ncbi:hypothetical protein [Pseudoxanthomonas sp.]|uniref:hypothetical protein n=1 Tax=Pseudoxanthomonas sp. TaxID=1871049 RepID=UPI00260595FF|nr:hypothetical protein [Pseudoxanthomonas sp.]WDS35955.1 MAG: hypothetical protein O8I58_16880 [Pseudoxanthomonas sp.]
MKRSVLHWCLAVCVLVSCGGTLPVTAAPTSALAGCATTEPVFRLVPGHFDFCVARKLWSSGDYRGAEKMLLQAARWADKNAQLALGVAYFTGAGLEHDRPLGLAWLALACERGNAVLQPTCDQYRTQATPQEQQAAQVRLARLSPVYADRVAAPRADRRYQKEAALMRGNPAYGGACIAGIDLIVQANFNSDPPTDADGCGLGSQMRTARILDVLHDDYFEGWNGKVQVGAPQSHPD